MKIFEVDNQTNLEHILKELKQTEEGLELSVVKGQTTVLDNPINKEIVAKVAEKLQKEVAFPAADIDQETPVEASVEKEDDELGFLKDEDVVAKAPIEEAQKMLHTAPPLETKPVAVNKKFNLAKLKNKKIILAGFGAIILLLIFFSFFLLPSATVTLTLNSQTKNSQINLTADPNADKVDTEKKIVPMQTQTVTKDGQDSANATGKKTIGVAAKGRVTITNRRNSPRIFLAGTVITSIGDTKVTFKLDADAPIPASQYPTGPDGTLGVNITATDVGPSGNLPAGTSFTVGDAKPDEVSAKNDTNFTGGSNQQVTVVSAADRENLKNKLLNNLSQAAQDDLQSKTKNSIVPTGSLETNVTKEVYQPAGVDAQADKVTLSLSVEAKAPLVDKSDLTEVLSAVILKDNSNFEVDQKNLDVDAEMSSKNSDGSLDLIGKIKTSLVPKIDKNEIKNKIKGKNLSQVKSYLDGQNGISSYKVNIRPSFFSILNFMPFFGSKITIEVSS